MQPGGLINYVTKRPLSRPAYAVQQQLGSFDNYRTTVDATGPLVHSGRVLYRFNAEYLDTDSFRDPGLRQAAHARTVDHVPSRASERNWTPTSSTRTTRRPTITVCPRLARASPTWPSRGYFGERTNKSTSTVNQQAVTLTHRLDERWSLKAKGSRYSMSGRFFETAIEYLDEASGIADRWLYDAPVSIMGYYGTADLNGTVIIGGMVHTLADRDRRLPSPLS